MRALNLSAADFLSAMQTLLPRGRFWNRDTDSVQTAVLSGLSPCYARMTDRANNLLIDAFPASTVELLPEWESTLGLPDSCAGESPTIQQRRAQVVARLTASGGQSAAYMKQFAAALGFTVEVRNYAPFRFGQSSFGSQLGSVDWMFVWAVIAPEDTVVPFSFGQSGFGEPFQSWGNDVLECEIRSVSPAQSLVLFQYTSPVADTES